MRTIESSDFALEIQKLSAAMELLGLAQEPQLAAAAEEKRRLMQKEVEIVKQEHQAELKSRGSEKQSSSVPKAIVPIPAGIADHSTNLDASTQISSQCGAIATPSSIDCRL